MALFNYTSREINAKIVYYGPGLSGKTTNIKHVYEKIVPDKKGKLITLPTYGDRTLFFDFFPLDAGEIKGYKIRFHLYTVPGQVFYNATRKLVLKGADGVVFVADSQEDMLDSNLESMSNLRKNLADHGINLDDFPFVVQYNKKDLSNILSAESLNRALNPKSVPFFLASAATGEGVLETLTSVSRLVLTDLKEMIETGRPRKRMPVQEEVRPITPSVVGIEIPQERSEDLRQWVVEGGTSAGAAQKGDQVGISEQRGEERVELGKPVPEVSRFADTVMEGILNVALNVKLRVVTTKEGDKIRVKEIEVSDFEPKEIDATIVQQLETNEEE
ncbi:MAG: hypothetical protein A2Z60_02420 [Nitrospirae bacterium RIFCSPLOWO2_02_42_7]|nr:MAG: hypothetical protein A2Z60_02420 [Nitrospirae bacterium RIFCSPLOWO2_02_42_7]HAS17605.1 hypothetical protein [Nitrospiraceae bacterium]